MIPPFVFDHKLNIMFMRKNWAGNNNFRILFSLWRIQQRRTGTWSTSLKIQTGRSRIFVHHPYLITSCVNWLELNFRGNLNITTPGNQTTSSLKCTLFVKESHCTRYELLLFWVKSYPCFYPLNICRLTKLERVHTILKVFKSSVYF